MVSEQDFFSSSFMHRLKLVLGHAHIAHTQCRSILCLLLSTLDPLMLCHTLSINSVIMYYLLAATTHSYCCYYLFLLLLLLTNQHLHLFLLLLLFNRVVATCFYYLLLHVLVVIYATAYCCRSILQTTIVFSSPTEFENLL